ncbi:MAG: thioredoxin [Aquificaceae bacterium]|nr:thioredoxin [Aquificaceae bacterium]MCS7197027.1 thioredoxin [Aquificaceae bacterium]MCX7989426.1 thioredoxin [Aquificaceae bacterium]MDW8032683.1 thioredoxin [Aquificaceae bacterium]MDW8295169.1 thioredoxin [Aquificaceae bacterium]
MAEVLRSIIFLEEVRMFEGFEELTDRDFYEKAMAGEKPAVVLLTTPDNPKNQVFYDALVKYQKLYGDKINFYWLDVSKHTSGEDLGVFEFPTALYFRDTMELERQDYTPSEEDVERAIRRLLRL